VADQSTIRFAEIELELKHGAPAALFAVAKDLARAAPLRLAPVTKSERGYGLLGGSAPAPVKARDIEIDPDASRAGAFQVIARSCLSQIIANEAVLRKTADPEAVHQMRVGLRRLRAAISLFKPMLADRETETVKRGLRWIGRKLGPARDLDVLLGNLREMTGSSLAEDALQDAERRRQKAYEILRKALDSPRYMSAILETAAWIEAGKWLAAGDLPSRSARKHAARELSRRHRKILRDARHMEELEDDERHELRIRIKKMRYGAEFFASLFDGKKSKKRRKAMLPELERLQDLLGEMNDIAVGGAMIPSLAQTDPEQARQRMAKLLSKAIATAHDLPAGKPFWK
jgi:CHAD domain-containing protein